MLGDEAGDGDRASLASSDGNRSRSSSNAALIDGDGQGFLERKSPATFPAEGGGQVNLDILFVGMPIVGDTTCCIRAIDDVIITSTCSSNAYVCISLWGLRL